MNFIQAGTANVIPFRPKEFTHAYAVAFKPTRVDRNIGQVKSEAECRLAVFDTEDAEPRVIENVVVTQGEIFFALLRAHRDEAVLIGYISQGELNSYGTRPWMVKDLDPTDAARIAEACEGVLA